MKKKNLCIMFVLLFIFVLTGFGYSGQVIDINKAGIKELVSLPGIGNSYAKRIIDYREKNGPFKKIEDLKKVKGIGNKKMQTIKDLIKIEENISVKK